MMTAGSIPPVMGITGEGGGRTAGTGGAIVGIGGMGLKASRPLFLLNLSARYSPALFRYIFTDNFMIEI